MVVGYTFFRFLEEVMVMEKAEYILESLLVASGVVNNQRIEERERWFLVDSGPIAPIISFNMDKVKEVTDRFWPLTSQ